MRLMQSRIILSVVFVLMAFIVGAVCSSDAALLSRVRSMPTR